MMVTRSRAVKNILDPVLDSDVNRDIEESAKWSSLLSDLPLVSDLMQIIIGYWHPCICFYEIENAPYSHHHNCTNLGDRSVATCTWCFTFGAPVGDKLHHQSCVFYLPTPCSSPLICSRKKIHVCSYKNLRLTN